MKKRNTLLLIIGGIMMLGGIVALGMSAIGLYISLCMGADLLSVAFMITALTVSVLQLILGLITMLKSDKTIRKKPFIITDAVIIALSVVLTVIMGKSLPTQMLTGFIVPLLHIIIINTKFHLKNG